MRCNTEVLDITEEQYLQEIERQQHINAHLLERLKDRGNEFRCSWCGVVPRAKKAAIFWNEYTGEVLFLHFSTCRHFPEPFKATRAGDRGWYRIDPWQNVKGTQPRLRNFKIVKSPSKQTTF